MGIDVKKLFDEDLPTAVSVNPAKALEIGHVFQMTITGENGGVWALDLTESGPSVTPGQAKDPELSITIAESDFQKLLTNPSLYALQMAFTGKLQLKGNHVLGIKLGKLFELASPRCC